MKKNTSSKKKVGKKNTDIQEIYKKYFSYEKRLNQHGFKIPTIIDYSIRTYVTDTSSDTENR